MPTEKEVAYQLGYRMGFMDGVGSKGRSRSKPKKRTGSRKLSDWQKFVKANSSKKKFKFANGKLKLKTMGIAYRKTAVYKRNKKK